MDLFRAYSKGSLLDVDLENQNLDVTRRLRVDREWRQPTVAADHGPASKNAQISPLAPAYLDTASVAFASLAGQGGGGGKGGDAKAGLGKKLFYDRRLSRERNMACATCHVPVSSTSPGRPTGSIRNRNDQIDPLYSSPDNRSTVRMNNLACDVTRISRSQKDITWGDFIRLAYPPHRGLLPKSLYVFSIKRGWNERCPDWPRRICSAVTAASWSSSR